MPMKTRRTFIKQTGFGIAGASVLGSMNLSTLAKSVAPSDTVNVGLIGCRGMGFWVLARDPSTTLRAARDDRMGARDPGSRAGG